MCSESIEGLTCVSGFECTPVSRLLGSLGSMGLVEFELWSSLTIPLLSSSRSHGLERLCVDRTSVSESAVDTEWRLRSWVG